MIRPRVLRELAAPAFSDQAQPRAFWRRKAGGQVRMMGKIKLSWWRATWYNRVACIFLLVLLLALVGQSVIVFLHQRIPFIDFPRRRLALPMMAGTVFLTAVLGLLLWLTFKRLALRPMEQEIDGRRMAEEELQEAYVHLENKFRERTEALEESNQHLRQEVDERHRSQLAIQSLHRYNELILKSAGEGLFGIDNKETISFINPAATRLFGYEERELLGQSPHQLLHHTRPDGTPYEKADCPIFKAIKTGKDFSTADEIFWRKDATSFPVEYVTTPIVENESVIGAVVVFRDISRRMAREKEKKELQAKLLHSQKMESIGRLAGGVAHDFNNLLTTIIGYADLSRLTIAKGQYELVQKNLEVIKTTGEKGAALVRHLLTFSRKQNTEMKPVDLRPLLENLSKMLVWLIGEDIKFSLRLKHSASVLADPSQLEQVVMNLSINARDAMPEGGALVIETADLELDEAFTRPYANTTAGQYVALSVSDNGVGMSPEVQENIFEPFFTTKEQGKGTGLGLATVFGIVEQHHGIIRVSSRPRQGSTFFVYLPASEANAIEGSTALQGWALPPARGEATILVVDDETALCNLIVDTLKPLGYQVLKATSGEEAMACCNDGKVVIDLLLTDMVMPGMNGVALARGLRAALSGIKVLYMSGYPAGMIAEHGIKLDEDYPFIQKPFAPNELIEKVREILKG